MSIHDDLHEGSTLRSKDMKVTLPHLQLPLMGVTLHHVTMVTLRLLLVTSYTTWVQAAPSWKEPIDHSKERWLADESYYDVFPDSPELPQNDGVMEAMTSPGACPPVPPVLPPGGCEVEECSSDRQCADRGLKCCYNGCTYTCLPEVKPAPFFDWLREPRRRFQSGSSWLIPGPNAGLNVSPCSTTQPDTDAALLRCPHGYVCSVIVSGDSKRGIPDQGLCVPERQGKKKHRHRKHKKGSKKNKNNKKNRGNRAKLQETTTIPSSESENSELVHGCDVGVGLKLIQGVTVLLEGRHCICKDTKLYCES